MKRTARACFPLSVSAFFNSRLSIRRAGRASTGRLVHCASTPRILRLHRAVVGRGSIHHRALGVMVAPATEVDTGGRRARPIWDVLPHLLTNELVGTRERVTPSRSVAKNVASNNMMWASCTVLCAGDSVSGVPVTRCLFVRGVLVSAFRLQAAPEDWPSAN